MINHKLAVKEIGYEHLHRHSHYSLLDGYATVEEYADKSKEVGQHFLCISDHGMMAAVPSQIRNCERISSAGHSLSPIYAMEAYVKDKHYSAEDRKSLTPEEIKDFRKSYHLLIIAKDIVGYHNLVALSSWGWINGYYYTPRITHQKLLEHKEGLIFTSCCYSGEIGQAFDRGGPEAAEAMLQKYMAMFGENFYLEFMLLDFSKQKPYDAWLAKMYEKYHVPPILSGDCHYSNKEDSKYQRYMLMTAKKTTIADIEKKLQGEDGQDIFELQDSNLWMKSEREMNDKWLERTESSPEYPDGFSYSDVIPLELFEQAKRNTVKICETCKNVKIDRDAKLPHIDDDKAKFTAALYEGMRWRGVYNKVKYRKRLQEEFELITRKGFTSYFLIQKMFTDEARKVCPQYLGWGRGHEAVGPGRGSGVSSLCNYVLGITDVDPLKHGLLFSRFLSEARGGKTMRTKFTLPPVSLSSEEVP